MFVLDRIFGAGDVVKRPYRWMSSALFAHSEAEFVASQIESLASLSSSSSSPSVSTCSPYQPPPWLICLSLGPDDGILATSRRVVCTGKRAAWFKRATSACERSPSRKPAANPLFTFLTTSALRDRLSQLAAASSYVATSAV